MKMPAPYPPSWARFPAVALFLLAACGTPGGQGGININICNSANSTGDCEQAATNTNVKQTEVTGTDNPPPPPPTEQDFVNEFLRGGYIVASRQAAWLKTDASGAHAVSFAEADALFRPVQFAPVGKIPDFDPGESLDDGVEESFNDVP